jgi:hypothetical protein
MEMEIEMEMKIGSGLVCLTGWAALRTGLPYGLGWAALTDCLDRSGLDWTGLEPCGWTGPGRDLAAGL